MTALHPTNRPTRRGFANTQTKKADPVGPGRLLWLLRVVPGYFFTSYSASITSSPPFLSAGPPLGWASPAGGVPAFEYRCWAIAEYTWSSSPVADLTAARSVRPTASRTFWIAAL